MDSAVGATIGLFGITLFLALLSLMRWKRRRDLVRERMNSKLRGYVAVANGAQPDKPKETTQDGESLIRVA
ncbi:MAG TPA: hypothetical protein VMH28_00720 [Candidatus Acidoferrales bacterium]|nr:hypothetical protein [Candidatus Acidoferrales bacterium]